jgi:hypothetical protein
MKPLPLLLIIALVASCGCVGTKPTHDFEINETRYFDFMHDDLHYGGNLEWDGEHFYIDADGYGTKEGYLVMVVIRGWDDDAVFQISIPESGMPSRVDRHADFSRTVLLNKMIRNRVNKPVINETMSPTAPTATPEPKPETKPVDILLADIIKNDVASKSYYTKIGGSKDVHICGNMACEQAEWIAHNYGYETGAVLLWSDEQDESHMQTWVMINDERYIFESTNNMYWGEPDHKDRFGGSNCIRFVPIKKGREHTKAAAEYYRGGQN